MTELQEELSQQTHREEWKDIPDFIGKYQVSNLGRIKIFDYYRSKGNIYIYNGITGEIGYNSISVYYNKKLKLKTVHRLVAQAFIPNPENKPQINHINGVKTDNRVDNLEWCTASENGLHAYKTGLSNLSSLNQRILTQKAAKNRQKIVLDKETGIFYDSIKEAAKLLKLNRPHLSLCLNNNKKNYTNLILV